MIHHHTLEEVRRFDLFKLIVTLVLIALLIALFLLRAARVTPAAPVPTVAAPEENASGVAGDGIEVESDVQADVDADAEAELPPAPEVSVLTGPLSGAELAPGLTALSGTGQPGSEVQITLGDDPVGTATVGEDGKWTFDTDLDQPGDVQVMVQALNASGEVVASSEPATFTVASPETELPAAPVLAFPLGGEALPLGELVLNGTGEPDSELEILDNGDLIGTATVDALGNWQFAGQPGEGAHEYVVRSTSDESLATEPVSVSVAPPVVERGPCSTGFITGTTYVVGSCETLSDVALRTERSVEALLGANPQVEDPDRIFAGQVLNIPQ